MGGDDPKDEPDWRLAGTEQRINPVSAPADIDAEVAEVDEAAPVIHERKPRAKRRTADWRLADKEQRAKR